MEYHVTRSWIERKSTHKPSFINSGCKEIWTYVYRPICTDGTDRYLDPLSSPVIICLTLGLVGFSYAHLNVQLTVNGWGDGCDGSGTLYILCSTGVRNQRRQLRTMRPEHHRFVEACCWVRRSTTGLLAPHQPPTLYTWRCRTQRRQNSISFYSQKRSRNTLVLSVTMDHRRGYPQRE